MSSKAINLMKGMLAMEAKDRMTAIECLAHPFFDGLRDDEINQLIQGDLQLKN